MQTPSDDIYARCTITPTGARQSFVTILKVPRTKIYQLRQDPQNEVFDDARLISNNLAKHVVAMLYPVPGATFTIGSILYPEGVQPPEIQSRTDGREVEEITFWLIESNPVP